MIINIRGTHGSGKTTAAYGVMKRLGVLATDRDRKPTRTEPQGTPIAYRLNHGVALIGKYTQACGGCDTIKTQDEICARIRRYHGLGFHVIFEGILTSQIYGRYSDLAREFGDDYVFAFLDTPLETAIERVRARRAEAHWAKEAKLVANGGSPLAVQTPDDFDPKNVVTKFNDVARVLERVKADGFKHVTVDHQKDTAQQLLDVLGLGHVNHPVPLPFDRAA